MQQLVIIDLTPLLPFLFVIPHRLERFRWRVLLGTVLTGEEITAGLLLGAIVVLVGVIIGVLPESPTNKQCWKRRRLRSDSFLRLRSTDKADSLREEADVDERRLLLMNRLRLNRSFYKRRAFSWTSMIALVSLIIIVVLEKATG